MPLSGFAAFRGIVWTALIAGFIGGAWMSVVQIGFTVPLILQAEDYERAPPPAHVIAHMPAEAHDAAHEPSHTDHGHAGHAASDAHPAHAEWAPADGGERTAYTALTSTLAAIGYALLLCGVLCLVNASGIRAGLTLGALGFVVFQLAPALGLPPELPGMTSADLAPRQAWWLGTAAATALACLCAYRAYTMRSIALVPVAMVLLALPHVIGAPHAAGGTGVVPRLLSDRFIATALIAGLLFWLVLGAATGHLLKRFVRPAQTA